MFAAWSASRKENPPVPICLAGRAGGANPLPEKRDCCFFVFILTTMCAQRNGPLLQADDSRHNRRAARKRARRHQAFSLLPTGNPRYRLIQTLILTTSRRAVGN